MHFDISEKKNTAKETATSLGGSSAILLISEAIASLFGALLRAVRGWSFPHPHASTATGKQVRNQPHGNQPYTERASSINRKASPEQLLSLEKSRERGYTEI